MRQPLYAHFAQRLSITVRPNVPENMVATAEEALATLSKNHLPHGGGWDTAPEVEHKEMSDGTPVNPRSEFLINSGFQRHDEVGNPLEWLDFTLRVYADADLLFPWDVEILEMSPRDDNLSEFILETFAEALGKVIDF